MNLTKNDPRHGTGHAYNLGCRCSVCKEAHNERIKKMRLVRKKKLKSNKTVKHGIPSTYYNHGCRCEKCSLAETKQQKKYKKARKSRRENLDGR